MAGSGSPKPNRPNSPKQKEEAPRKPLQVLHITRKEKKDSLSNETLIANPPEAETAEKTNQLGQKVNDRINSNQTLTKSPNKAKGNTYSQIDIDAEGSAMEGLSMADLLSSENQSSQGNSIFSSSNQTHQEWTKASARSVDDFDFDEDAFLAALDENEPIGTTGEIVKGFVIDLDSDAVYVDIGGKAPGYMPKNECGLGIITNLKERFPKGLEVEVLVTREQNADGMVTISCRALALRQSWEKVKQLEQEGKVVRVKVNGFNRGGVTCELEGLRGFIPRSQLENGENHETLIGKTLGVAFLEVNPDTRKLVLSEKRASTVARFAELEIGQLVEGEVTGIKQYGYFIDLGGVSGLLHHSMVTNGSLRSLREVFKQGDQIKALITELDPARGRIGLNTALLEGPPGEILIEKDKIMSEASERAQKAINILKQTTQTANTSSDPD